MFTSPCRSRRDRQGYVLDATVTVQNGRYMLSTASSGTAMIAGAIEQVPTHHRLLSGLCAFELPAPAHFDTSLRRNRPASPGVPSDDGRRP